MEKANYCVYIDKNYSHFKLLPGNRAVTESHTAVIKKSIEKHGFLHNPILVNENMEIIEGQNRFYALKELGLPIEFMIQKGIGLNECRALNINQRNWAVGDWINSYADLGDSNYMYLRNLLKMFKRLGMSTITCAVNGGMFISSTVISRGDFICSKEQYDSAIEALTFTNRLLPYVAEVQGRKDILTCAIVFIYMNETDADMSVFEKKFIDNFRLLPPIASLESCLLHLENIYNKRNRKTLCNFANDYKAFSRDRGIRCRADREYNDYAERHHIYDEA